MGSLAVPSQTFQRLVSLDLHREAEVGQFDVHLIVQEDVLRLQVAMDNALAVEELHHLHQSAHDLPNTTLTRSQMHVSFPLERFRTEPELGLTWFPSHSE